jgi:hypothetical protein
MTAVYYLCKEFDIYFLCLDAKKVTKKNQGKPERSARFAVPEPHITDCFKF